MPPAALFKAQTDRYSILDKSNLPPYPQVRVASGYTCSLAGNRHTSCVSMVTIKDTCLWLTKWEKHGCICSLLTNLRRGMWERVPHILQNGWRIRKSITGYLREIIHLSLEENMTPGFQLLPWFRLFFIHSNHSISGFFVELKASYNCY